MRLQGPTWGRALWTTATPLTLAVKDANVGDFNDRKECLTPDREHLRSKEVWLQGANAIATRMKICLPILSRSAQPIYSALKLPSAAENFGCWGSMERKTGLS